jgi:predicted phosphoribosyltransferase
VRYRDRVDAGRKLAGALEEAGFGPDDRPLVLGVARGGVPVAVEVAAMLGGDLDVAVARKIGAPGNPEFAIGAIAVGGEPILNEVVIRSYQISPEYVASAVDHARDEIERRTIAYRAGRPAADPAGRVVIVVDDGVATGSTLKAVLRSVRAAGPASVVCAIPVGPSDTVQDLTDEADVVVCPSIPRSFMAVGGWYDDFSQLSDEEVVAALAE